eukprot:CAMPEP_0177782166 /NCGR_PEP_ID=MMETSP0491_2-20121128/18293_1 /TAXON_ID=63592 /ORGANISM="Tetraselmis chuii, Strain PLY429" /LENGTH=69 /DNA_ID=CAMNT_0019302389 /DNA_START=62 /DNA_END=268 /DNA_ORIENTATION=-
MAEACLSQMMQFMTTVAILHMMPTTVKEVADTMARSKKAEYDMATPTTQETVSAAMAVEVHSCTPSLPV